MIEYPINLEKKSKNRNKSRQIIEINGKILHHFGWYVIHVSHIWNGTCKLKCHFVRFEIRLTLHWNNSAEDIKNYTDRTECIVEQAKSCFSHSSARIVELFSLLKSRRALKYTSYSMSERAFAANDELVKEKRAKETW